MHPKTRKWLLGIAALGVWYAASFGLAPLNRMREEHKLLAAPIRETADPSMMYTPLLALGRAPLVDYLWIRATKLKDEGRYFDAYQLSRMICELQPRFAAVWAFQAWNMAYNISVTLNTPEERWRWVRNGFELLRDKAIPLNPNNTQLYKELAWIFFHKVGDFMDEMHHYYKLQLALIVEDILGEPPEDYVRPGRPRDDYYREYDYQTLADAPTTVEALMAEPEVKAFADRLREEFSFDSAQPGQYLGVVSGLRNGDLKIPNTPAGTEEHRMKKLRELMSDPKTADARRQIEAFWRATRLRNELKIDPQRMVELKDAFGVSLDLRVAETHSLYWANLGLEKGADKRVALDAQKLNTNRIEFFCLQKMFLRGRIAMSPASRLGEPPLLNPDIRFGEILFQTYLREAPTWRLADAGGKAPVDQDTFSGFVGFVRQLILRYEELGWREPAREKFEFLAEHYPDPMYAHGYEEFIKEQFRVDRTFNNYDTAMQRINALVDRGIIQLAYGEDDEAGRYFTRARQVYDTYQKVYGTISQRQEFKRTFQQMLEERVHFGGSRFYGQTYELVCKKLKIKPITSGGETFGTDQRGRPGS